MADLRAARILITGHAGFLGRHLVAVPGFGRSIAAPFSRDRATGYNLEDRHVTQRIIEETQPDAVVHLAYPGSAGGILTARDRPASLTSGMLRADLNVIEACAWALHQPRLLCIGSVCAYPAHTTPPTVEADLWEGYPDPVNAPYGIAKRMQLVLLQAFRQEYGLKGLHLILGNLYGPGDRSSHVIPATIRKVRRALRDGGPVVIWGHPEVTRSFLFVKDAAEGIVRLLESDYDDPVPLNLAAGEIAMAQLAQTIADQLGYTGPIAFDDTQPTGQRRRQLSSIAFTHVTGWRPPTAFADGIAQTIAWHLQEDLDV